MRVGRWRLWLKLHSRAPARMMHSSSLWQRGRDRSPILVLGCCEPCKALSRAIGGPQALLPDIRHESAVRGATFDQAEGRILSWSLDGTVRLWDAATGQPRGAPMKHDGAVDGALFDQAQARILSWSDDGTVRLWDAATGQPRGAPMKHDGAVMGALFDQAEARILSWSE